MDRLVPISAEEPKRQRAIRHAGNARASSDSCWQINQAMQSCYGKFGPQPDDDEGSAVAGRVFGVWQAFCRVSLSPDAAQRIR
jgi:hypothetical protein